MANIWIPERELKQEYGDRIKSVDTTSGYFTRVYENTAGEATYGIGGRLRLEPVSLVEKVIETYLNKNNREIILGIYIPSKEPLFVLDAKENEIPFEYLIRIIHPNNYQVADLKFIAKSVAEVRDARFVMLAALANPEVIPNLKSYLYYGYEVGLWGSTSEKKQTD